MRNSKIQEFKHIGSAGGLARNRLYGNPGTDSGRRLGGLNSYAVNMHLHNGFKKLKTIPKIHHSESLAELLGIIAGDGHIDKYQVTITTNSETDYPHAHFVQALFYRIFKMTPSIKPRSDSKALTICLSSKEACDFLVKSGIPRGHKIKNIKEIPEWIQSNNKYKIAFIRGLFDTDGCFYVDKHLIKNELYENPGMNFSNRSLPLLSCFKNTLLGLNLSPTTTTKHSIVLRREKDIVRYFCEVGSSNPKHFRKFNQYFRAKYGRVPKRS